MERMRHAQEQQKNAHIQSQGTGEERVRKE